MISARLTYDGGHFSIHLYVRVRVYVHEGRAAYECVDAPSRAIWFAKPYWCATGRHFALRAANGLGEAARVP